MPISPENRKRYPKDWPAISLAIRSRADWQCECIGECGWHPLDQRCASKQGEPNPRTQSRVVLTVAHLDHVPENCDDKNLKAMCQQCHLSYDADHHRQNSYESRRKNKAMSDLLSTN